MWTTVIRFPQIFSGNNSHFSGEIVIYSDWKCFLPKKMPQCIVHSSAFCDRNILFMQWAAAFKIRIIKNQIQWRQSAATNIRSIWLSFEHLLRNCAQTCWPYHLFEFQIGKSLCGNFRNMNETREWEREYYVFWEREKSFEFILFSNYVISSLVCKFIAIASLEHANFLMPNGIFFCMSSMPIGMLTQWCLLFSQIFLITCWRLDAISRKRFILVFWK